MAETNPQSESHGHGWNGLSAALLALGFVPLTALALAELWATPWTRGWPLAIAGAVLLAWRGRRGSGATATPGNARVWVPLLGVSLALLGVAALRWSHGLGLAAAGVALVAGCGWVGGRALTRGWMPGYALLAVGIGGSITTAGVVRERLEAFVLRAADQLLYTLEVPHWLGPGGFELTAVTVPRADLFSGLNGLPALLTLALVLLLALRRHPLRIGLALAALVIFLVPGEVWRVALGVRACEAGAENFFRTWQSGLLTAALWALSFALMLSVDQLLGFLTEARLRSGDLPPEPAAPVPPATSGQGAIRVGKGASGLAWSCAGTSVVLGLLTLGLGWLRWEAREEVASADGLRPELELAMPDVGEGWRPIPDNAVIAAAVASAPGARSWQWQRGQTTLALSLEGPLATATDPLPGYAQAGWKFVRNAPAPPATTASPPLAEVDLTRPPMLHAVLFYGWFEPSGRWLEPDDATTPAAGSQASPLYRVQALAVGARPWTDAERASATQAFNAARLALAAQLRRSPGSN